MDTAGTSCTYWSCWCSCHGAGFLYPLRCPIAPWTVMERAIPFSDPVPTPRTEITDISQGRFVLLIVRESLRKHFKLFLDDCCFQSLILLLVMQIKVPIQEGAPQGLEILLKC